MRKKTSAIRVRNANPVAASLPVTPKLCGTDAKRSSVVDRLTKKLQDSERTLQLNFANSASLNLRQSHAQPCDAPSVQRNKHEPFGRLATVPSQPGQQR